MDCSATPSHGHHRSTIRNSSSPSVEFPCIRKLLTIFCMLLGVLRATTSAAERPAEHVVVISVDGLPAYLFDDVNVPLSSIRELAQQGVVAAGMTVSNPSVTWPNHTSLVTGTRPVDHGVLFNGVLRRPGLGLPVKVDPRTDKAELVRQPTIYDAAHQQGLSTAAINWPCTRNSGTLNIDFPDTPDSLEFTTAALLASLKASGDVTADEIERFPRLSPIARDRVWTEAACHVIRTRKPNLLLLHLLNVDAMHHRYGPQTWPGYAAVAYADRCVKDVLDALDEAGIREQTAVFVVADHGFMSIPKTLHPNVLLRQVGMLTVEGNQITAARAMVVPEGGAALLYLTHPESEQADLQKAIELFQHQEGIAEILVAADFEKFGLPQPGEYPQMANLLLAAREGYGISGSVTGDQFVAESTSTLGTHGFLSTQPRMNAMFVAAGSGIRSGLKLGTLENIQVAPTIARLLGIDFPSARGELLGEILIEP